jgi:uncharacterized membrane protein YGL010W
MPRVSTTAIAWSFRIIGKIEHRARSAIDNLVHQLGTPEGRAILGAVGAAVGFDPTVARMVTANIPLADNRPMP